jgi:hypothetical protein
VILACACGAASSASRSMDAVFAAENSQHIEAATLRLRFMDVCPVVVTV